VSFLILVWILAKFAWKPLTNMMEKRRQNIEDMLTKAENDRREAESIRLKHQEELRKAHQEAQALIEKATKAGELRAAEIMEQARSEAEKIKQTALEQINVERARAVAEIQAQVADISVAVAEKILRHNLDAAAQQGMIDQFIQEVEVGDRVC
jgi:F-type H+-transporting ATPase subunit b